MTDSTSTFGAFTRLYKIAPNGRTIEDLARTVVFLTGANTPYHILKKLGYEVRYGTAGGEWLILPSYNPKKDRRGTIVIDNKRAPDVDIACCECLCAILFDHFGRLGASIPKDVSEKRTLLYKEFSEALLNALKE